MSSIGKMVILMPPELLVIISNHLDYVDQLSLSLSRLFQGFDLVYNMNRNERDIVINYRSHFLSQPSNWYRFFHQHPLALSSISIFSVVDCYWIPSGWLRSAIARMENLEELTISGTKMSLAHLPKVFQTCKKITALDFSYNEKIWEDIQGILKKEELDLMIQSFKKITCLKMSTSFVKATDYLHDPMLLIIRILSWCQNCTDLTIKLAGDYIERKSSDYPNGNTSILSPAEKEVKKMVKAVLFPQLEWMTTKLKSLVLIALHPNSSSSVRSLLFNYLFEFVVLPYKNPRPHPTLERLWVENFYVNERHLFEWSFFTTPMESFFVEETVTRLTNDVNNFEGVQDFQLVTQDEYFHRLEHMGPLSFEESDEHERPPGGYLPNLKSARIECYVDDGYTMLDHFVKTHPNLEHLQVDFNEDEAVNNYVFKVDSKLLTLTSLIFATKNVTTEMIEALVQVCPNISVLHINNHREIPGQSIENDWNVLSAIRFRNLTTLHLHGSFQFHDGSFLLKIIEQCPKLENLHMNGTFEPDLFPPNFDRFVTKATHLRELRLGLDFKGIGSPLMLLLGSLLKSFLILERLFLFDNAPFQHRELGWIHPTETADIIVQFATKMKRLLAFCVEFYQLNPALVEEIKSRIVEEVVPARSNLWFHIDRERPNLVDVPPIHYFGLIEPNYSLPLPKF